MPNPLKASDNTKEITDVLKSVAILVVMVGHYAQYLASDYYDSWFRGFAFGTVAIFFVLAGYGASFSLGKRFGQESWKAAVPGYYLNRALRIYPAYWVALLLTASYFPEYDLAFQLDLYTVAVYLGFPFVNAPGIFWFVPAIILCYLLAPLIYALLAKIKTGKYFAILLGSVPVSLAVTVIYLQSSGPDAGIFTWSNLNILFYKDYFLSTVLLFSLGLAINNLVSRPRIASWSKALIVPSVLLFVLMLYLTRDSYTFYDQGYDLYLILMAPVFIASCYAMCLVTIASNIKIPFARVAGIPGRYSYQLYLFHMLYIALLARFNLIEDNDLRSLVVFLALLPVMILIFHGIGYAFNSDNGSESA
jgi:peptidoglycan/LPS O-acetylase OafA/YrhL